jgi:hypothetical protein
MEELEIEIENYTELFELFGEELFCVVCQDKGEDGQRILEITRCKHMFHETCLEPWLRQKGTCPLCRVSILGDQHRQFFYRQHLLTLLQIIEQQMINERRLLTWVLCDGILKHLGNASDFQTQRERCETVLRNFNLRNTRPFPIEFTNRNRLLQFAGQMRQQLLQTYQDRSPRIRTWTDVLMTRRYLQDYALMNPEFQMIWE